MTHAHARSLPLLQASRPRAVRVSVTDRCDLACTYCRPGRNEPYLSTRRRLSPADWERLVGVLVQRGVSRVRITGGEPLVHPDIVEIVARIAKVPGVSDLALTTNGTRLEPLASSLRKAGLHRLNVSIDSLDPERFWRITRGGRLGDVLAGVEAARSAGLGELKTNTVVLGGEDGNVGELADITRWAWSMDATPRFLELMPVGAAANLNDRFVSHASMRARLEALLEPADALARADRGPARYVIARGKPERAVGFITGASASFCEGCDRLRVSSDGLLRPCLATGDTFDIRAAIVAGDEHAIERGFDDAWAQKPDGTTFRGCAETSAMAVDMRVTGG